MLTRLKRCGPWLILIFTLSVLAYAAFFEIDSPDLFWHLKMGQDWLTKGLSPFVDHSSFTYANSSMHFVAWPFQALLFLFYDHFGGVVGIQLLRALLWACPVGLLFYFFQKRKVSFEIQLLAFLFLISAFVFRAEPRPELGSYTLTLLCVFFFIKARENFCPKNLWPFALILLFWSNYHTSSILGFIIVSSLYFEQGIRLVKEKAPRRSWMTWGGMGALTFAVGFLNRDFTHIIFAEWGFKDDWGKYIDEYIKLDFSMQPAFVRIYWVLLVGALLGALAEGSLGIALIMAFLGFKAWYVNRLLPHLVVATLPLMALWAQTQKEFLKRKFGDKFTIKYFVPGAMVLLVFYLGSVIAFLTFFNPTKAIKPNFTPHYFPQDLVGYLEKNKFSGNVLNEFAQGGYLSFALDNRLKVYIDGRTFILFPFDFFEKYMFLSHDPQLLSQEVTVRKIDYVVGFVDQSGGLFDTVVESGLFTLDYVGSHNALLSPSSFRFKTITTDFVHPECLQQSRLPEYERELSRAVGFLPESSQLLIFLKFVTSYFKAKDPIAFLNQPQEEIFSSSRSVRAAATLASELNLWDRALYYYDHMPEVSPRVPRFSRRDIINRVHILCKAHQCRGVEDLIADGARVGLQIDPNLKQDIESPLEPDWCKLRQ